MIADLMEIIQPLLNSQETRPSKRTRTGLSVEEREARVAFQLMKEKKRMEIYEFCKNYKGPPYHPVERSLWGPLCRSYECPIRLEAFGHEAGEDCLLNPKEVWKLPPIEIILKPEAVKAYMAAEAALAEAARGEACKLRMEDMLPLTSESPTPEAARHLTWAAEAGWKYSGMKPYTSFYCLDNEDEC